MTLALVLGLAGAARAVSCGTVADCPPCAAPLVPGCGVTSDPNTLQCKCVQAGDADARGCSAVPGRPGPGAAGAGLALGAWVVLRLAFRRRARKE